MLDGVFNHTGRKRVYFTADGLYGDLGAAQGEQSPCSQLPSAIASGVGRQASQRPSFVLPTGKTS